MRSFVLRILRESTKIAALLAVCAAAQAASTWTVTTTGSRGTCTANSVTDPNCTLDVAIFNAAAEGDTILFAPAVQGHTITNLFTISRSVTIDGGPGGVTLDGTGLASAPVLAVYGHTVYLKNTYPPGLADSSD